MRPSVRSRRPALVRLLLLALPFCAASAANDAAPPAWAYPVNPPGFKPAADDGGPRRVPGSTATYSLSQVRDRFLAPDWHPGDHPPMPEVVARGRKPGVYACGYCHRADGPGGPENASLAGLSEAYMPSADGDRLGSRRTLWREDSRKTWPEPRTKLANDLKGSRLCGKHPLAVRPAPSFQRHPAQI